MMRCAECDCKHGGACCTWIKSNRPCAECAKAAMSDALQRLIDAVEAGSEAPFYELTYSQLDTFGQRFIDLTQQANRGDLNAAKALHDALLPGWHWTADDGQGQDLPFWHVFEFDGARMAEGEADTPARAWLIAILAAYQQVQQ